MPSRSRNQTKIGAHTIAIAPALPSPARRSTDVVYQPLVAPDDPLLPGSLRFGYFRLMDLNISPLHVFRKNEYNPAFVLFFLLHLLQVGPYILSGLSPFFAVSTESMLRA